MILEILLVLIIVILVIFRWKRRKILALYSQISSSITWLPFIGHSYILIGNSEHQMKALQRFARETTEKGGVVGYWHAFTPYVMITDAAAAECVLKSSLSKDDIMKVTHVVIGNGSIFTSVPIWRPRRKVLAPTFGPKMLKSFVPIFSQQSDVLTDQMKASAGKGPVSMWQYLNPYAMDSVCESTMGVKVEVQKDPQNPIMQTVDTLFQLAATRVTQPYMISDFVFKKLPYYTTVMKCKKLVCDFIDEIIQQKRISMKKNENAENNGDAEEETLKTFIELIIESSKKETTTGFTDLELREEIMVLLFAGTDTSAVGASYSILLLSRHPDVQEKVYQELQEVFGDSDRPLDAADLPRLKYLEAVIKETLRLYPPVPIVTRKVEKDVTLPSGVTLVDGCSVLINIWGVHHNPRYWGDDVGLFRPERFIDTPHYVEAPKRAWP